MVFLKSLVFILINVLCGYLFVYTIKFILFYPRTKKYIFNKKIPFTPGLIPRKKDWLINKVETLLRDYLRDCKINTEKSRVTRWENKVFKKAWNKCEYVEKIKYLPGFIKEKLHYICSLLAYEFAKQFLRDFVPYLMERYNIKQYINLADKKIDIDTIRDFYNKYIYKYSLYIVLTFFGLMGLLNMLIYLIIQ